MWFYQFSLLLFLATRNSGDWPRSSTFQEWSKASGIAKAFSIGKAESEAVSALMTTVKKEVTERLSEAVRARGMLKFLHHDVISNGLFSTNFTSASGESESWKDQLRNREDGQLVACHASPIFWMKEVFFCCNHWCSFLPYWLTGEPKVDAFVTRLIGDFDKSAKSLRKAITFKEAVIIHQSTGCFLHFLKAFQQMAPASFFDESKENLLNQFNQGFLDPDLCHILTLQVPPGDIKSVAAFRCQIDWLHVFPVSQFIKQMIARCTSFCSISYWWLLLGNTSFVRWIFVGFVNVWVWGFWFFVDASFMLCQKDETSGVHWWFYCVSSQSQMQSSLIHVKAAGCQDSCKPSDREGRKGGKACSRFETSRLQCFARQAHSRFRALGDVQAQSLPRGSGTRVGYEISSWQTSVSWPNQIGGNHKIILF